MLTPGVILKALCHGPGEVVIRGDEIPLRCAQIVRGLRQGLTELERYAVADHVGTQLKQRGDPWHLTEEARLSEPPST